MVSIVVVVRRPLAAVSPAATGGPAASEAPSGEVVVPLDGGAPAERALAVAASLAGELGARLHLVTTVDSLPEASPSAYLEQVASRIAEADGVERWERPVGVDTDVTIDRDPADVIAELAGPASVVCMATHARGRLSSALHQEVAAAVVARASGAVVLVGPACRTERLGSGPVVVAHDGSRESTEASRPLVALAARLGRDVEVVRVASAPSGHATEHPYADTDHAIAPLLALARTSGCHATERIVFGRDVHRALMAEADRVGASMIAMAMHRRTRAERLRDGSTTMHVVHDAKVPVLVRHADEPAG